MIFVEVFPGSQGVLMRVCSWSALLPLVAVSVGGCVADAIAPRYPAGTVPTEGPTDDPATECVGDASPVTVMVTPGVAPLFDWRPTCPAALLLVEHRGSDQWGITTDESTWDRPSRANLIAPPVTYGSVPPSAEPLGPAPPEELVPEIVYDLFLFRAVAGEDAADCLRPAGELCLVGVQEFYADRPPPSGAQIAFWSDHDGSLDIYVVTEDGSKLRRLTNETTMDVLPSWSPGGLRLAYASGTAGSFALHVMTEMGTDAFSLGVGGAGGHDWSPDGTRIVMASGGDLFGVRPDGGGIVQVTDTPEEESDPAWSPDGTRIAFAQVTLTPAPAADIYVLDSEGGRVRLTDDERFDVGPAWSPDGTRIAYTSWRDPDWQVRVMNADGSGSVVVTEGRSPSWSPDGSRLVFVHPDGGLVTVASDGSELERLTDFGFDPDWSAQPQG